MALDPNKKPDPIPKEVPHHSHYLPPDEWETVKAHAVMVREADDESETD